MALIINNEIVNQFSNICQLSEKIKFSALLGTIDIKKNEIHAISVVHFPEQKDTKITAITLDEDDINQLKALKIMVPYNLEIIGLVFYCETEITTFTLKSLAEKITDLKSVLLLVNVQKETIDYYQISKEKLVKITAKTEKLMPENLLSFIHTMEFETDKEVLKKQTKLKKSLFEGIDVLWDKIIFNKEKSQTLGALITTKSSLDRIIEINIPCEEKQLSSKTKEGNVFLAIDLHINFYVAPYLKDKSLDNIKGDLNKALKQDLLIKLQRSIYDENVKRLITPGKIPLKFFGTELNAYLSKENPSKFEYDLNTNLIDHAKIMSLLNYNLQARIFLRDLNIYFSTLKDTEKQKSIESLLVKLSE